MKINILTLFPEMFLNIFSTSIIGKAIEKSKIEINLINFRDFTYTKNRQVDDYPYGGGAGMILKPEPIGRALDFIKAKNNPVIYFTPQGNLLNQKKIHNYLNFSEITLICGHYKEIDQRIRDIYVTDELSIGDYVVSGGELPAMILIDALSRLSDDVLNNLESALMDSHQDGILGCPYYTRPKEYKELKVPDELLSGDPKKISKWREKKAFEITYKRRPELLYE